MAGLRFAVHEQTLGEWVNFDEHTQESRDALWLKRDDTGVDYIEIRILKRWIWWVIELMRSTVQTSVNYRYADIQNTLDQMRTLGRSLASAWLAFTNWKTRWQVLFWRHVSNSQSIDYSPSYIFEACAAESYSFPCSYLFVINLG